MEVRSLSYTGEALKAARLTAGHENASAFAKLVDLTPNSVYRLERGELTPSAQTLVRWADACGVTVDALADAASHEPAPAAAPADPEAA